LNNSAPLLFNHNVDKLLGVVEKAWIVEDRVYVRVRFSRNDDFADRIFKDILDGLIKNISIGYVV
jgi:phage head maturation protease